MINKEKILSDMYVSVCEMNIAYLDGDMSRVEFERNRQKELRKLFEMV